RAARPRSGGLSPRQDRGVGWLHGRKDPPVRRAEGARRHVRRRLEPVPGALRLHRGRGAGGGQAVRQGGPQLPAQPAVRAPGAAGKRAVDLSADFRLWPEAVYGLTEVTRPRVAAAELVANPGCYPTAALLALLPLARQGLIDASREVVIDAASGVTGAGRAPKRELMFGEVAEDFRAYAVGNEHRHLPELLATLARESGFTGDLVFTPHLLPVKRGILETIHVPLTRALDQTTAEELYLAAYDGEPCVAITRGTLPS